MEAFNEDMNSLRRTQVYFAGHAAGVHYIDAVESEIKSW